MPYPTKKTPEVVEEVLARLAQGEMLAPILKSDKKFPHWTAWDSWVRADEALALAYRRAREEGYDCIAREALAIADNANADACIAVDAHGKPYAKLDGEMVARSRLRVDTRLKLLAKWNPSKYGEQSTLNIGNKDGEVFKVASAIKADAALHIAALMREQARQGLIEHKPAASEDDGSDLV